MPSSIRIIPILALLVITLPLLCSEGYAESPLDTGKGVSSFTLSRSSLGGALQLFDVGGNNVLVADLEDGLVLVDGGLSVHGEQLSQALKKLTAKDLNNKNVLALFNSHWHPEQLGLNLLFGREGIPIIAHENTKQWMRQSHYRVWTNDFIPASQEIALPSQTFYQRDELALADETIEYGHLLQAHTDGDIYVYFKKHNVLAIGGIINSDRWPVIDWWSAGWIGGMLDGLEILLAIADDETKIVPAHGPVMNKAQLQKEYDMYQILFERIFALLKQSKSPADAAAEIPTLGFHPEWDNAESFTESAFRSLFGHLRGEKRMGLMP